MGLEEPALEKCSPVVPLIYYPEKSSEHGAGNFERKISSGTPACTKRFRSLLVTIENHTPLIELAQSLGTRALPEILPIPEEGTKKSCKCPECDQSFSHSSYLVLHQKAHAGKKKCKCDDCGKIFNHRSNLRAHKMFIGEKPYKCAQCGGSFRQPSHLSQHRKAHPKEKIHRCGICGRGFTRLQRLSQHQKTDTATKASDKYVSQKTNLALPEEKHGSAAQQPCSPGRKCFGQPSYPVRERPQGQSEHYSSWGGILLSFLIFKPLKCPECSKTFLPLSLSLIRALTVRKSPINPKHAQKVLFWTQSLRATRRVTQERNL